MFRNRWLIFLHDAGWVPLSVVIAYALAYDFQLPPDLARERAFVLITFALPAHLLTFTVFGCYRGIWRFASVPDLMRLLGAVSVGAILTAAFISLVAQGEQVIPTARFLTYAGVLLMGTGGVRVLVRSLNESARLPLKDRQERLRALIVGAGSAGEVLVRDFARSPNSYRAIAFLDDDLAKQGQELQGVRVVGRVSDLRRCIERLEIQIVLIAMPSAPREVMETVIRMCAETGVECRTLPSMVELANGRVEVSRLRPVTVDDLLGRDPVRLDVEAIAGFLRGKTVLVTGGGGSIGSELCRQILGQIPEVLVIVENSEFNLYQIELELHNSAPHARIKPVLSDVRNAAKMDRVMQAYRPDVVFHAAAYKHVPMLEHNPLEGIINNVLGTRVMADLAVKHGVSKFILVSTDKTVNPTNVMGATKRVAEVYCQSLNGSGSTRFITTRFGNVLASAGSVVPLFQEQIRRGGPVTVTHPEITRYFMTIPEAAGLILQAGAMGEGGEIFVLDMGQPVRINDLAHRMIQLSGLRPGVDIEVRFTGLRPGEKMHEELFYATEPLLGTNHPKLMLAGSAAVDQASLRVELDLMLEAAERGDAPGAVSRLKALIPEFRSNVEAAEREEMLRSSPVLRVVR
jgi:FlaA1/EpsC-like NDP-sugar epimerase